MSIKDFVYRATYVVYPLEDLEQMPSEWQSQYKKLVGELNQSFPSLAEHKYTAFPVDEDYHYRSHDEDDDSEEEKGEVVPADVLPVCLLLSMSDEWQDQMLKVMEGFAEKFEDDDLTHYEVDCPVFNKFDNRKEIFEPLTEIKLWGWGGRETNKYIEELQASLRVGREQFYN